MSDSMILEDKFEALKKNYQSISSSNQELKNQNEYLRLQLGEATKQKKRALVSPSGSIEDETSDEGYDRVESSSKEPQRRPQRE